MNATSSLWDVLRYKRTDYPIIFLLLFSLVIFENFSLGPTLSLSDIIYFFFAVYFFIRISSVKHTNSRNLLLYPVSFLVIALVNYVLFHAQSMFLSQVRFVFNCSVFAIVGTYFLKTKEEEKEKLISTYVYVCVLASLFIIVQFLSFYLLRYNLKFDFGSFQGSINAASLAVPGQAYRTGGFFKEPSWFAVFIGPVLDITYKRKQLTELIICIIGIVMSTSSMGFLFIFVFLLFNLRSNKKYIALFVLILVFLYYIFPSAFERLFDALDFSGDPDNSNDSRVIAPFTLIFETKTFPLLGVNIENLYALFGERLFLNTFLFVLVSFGIVGMLLFLKMIYKRRLLSLTIIILLTVIIEGCYGRIDFWLPMIAATIFESTYNSELS